MTIWAWLLAGLIGLLVYINLGHLVFYVDLKATWAWSKNKKFNLAAKVLLPSPTTFGISPSPLLLDILNNGDASGCRNFASYYDANYSPTFVAIWPIMLGLAWLISAADWLCWLLSVVFYKWLIRDFIYGVLISGKWIEKLR